MSNWIVPSHIKVMAAVSSGYFIFIFFRNGETLRLEGNSRVEYTALTSGIRDGFERCEGVAFERLHALGLMEKVNILDQETFINASLNRL